MRISRSPHLFALAQRAALALPLALLAGCFYSKQEYQPPGFPSLPRRDTSLVNVIKEYGAPDFVAQYGDHQVLVWRAVKGYQIFNVYSTVEKHDLVVIGFQGKVSDSKVVPKGQGLSVLSGFQLPITEID